jgi:S-DNA-T family DNA segregation ATPase FtsK/SpoIIIE
MEWLGYAGFLLAVALLVAAINRLRGRRLSWRQGAGHTGAFVILLLAIATLLDLGLHGHGGDPLWRPGGVAGDLTAQGVTLVFGSLGGYLVVGTGAILASMAVTRLSVLWMFGALWRSSATAAERLREEAAERRARLDRVATLTRKIDEKNRRPKPRLIEAVPVELEVGEASQEVLLLEGGDDYQLPPLTLLADPPPAVRHLSEREILVNSEILERKLLDFGVSGEVTEVHPGPVITMYEFQPAPGVKVSKIANLADDLAMALRALSIRIVAPIPGKGAVGIEVPNLEREGVYLRQILASEVWDTRKFQLPIALGKDIFGNPVVSDLARMPHLLVAGATGSGKSVCINSIIASILFRARPDQVKLLMVDPKMLELLVYEGIPHLITPVVTDPKKASVALGWAVKEMERRYTLLSAYGVRNIVGFNKMVTKMEKEGTTATPDGEGGEAVRLAPLPYIVVLIDELADLMLVASREVEVSIARLAQMARAAGIHLIVATQRPSVDVLTGVIKANFPARIAFQVSSKTDSRTIIDANGAEALLGQGDMLFLPPGVGKVQRVHGTFLGDGEIKEVANFIRKQARADYDLTVTVAEREAEGDDAEAIADELYDEAVRFAVERGKVSVSLVQRRFRIGYNRAARIVEWMERDGIVAPADGAKPRDVIVDTQ